MNKNPKLQKGRVPNSHLPADTVSIRGRVEARRCHAQESSDTDSNVAVARGKTVPGHVRSSTRQRFRVGGSNRGHGRVPGSRSSISPGTLARAARIAAAASSGRAVNRCQQFIDRATKRIEDLDRARETESIRLKESRDDNTVCSRKSRRGLLRCQSLPTSTNDIGAEVEGQVGRGRARWFASTTAQVEGVSDRGRRRMFRLGHPIHANFGARRARRLDEGPTSGSSGGPRVRRDRSRN